MNFAFSGLTLSIFLITLVTNSAEQTDPLIESKVLESSRETTLRATHELWENLQVLSPEDLRETSSFGSTTSVYRDLLIIGAPNAAQDGISSGAAYIYRYNRTKETWEREAILLPNDPEDGDFFGRSVSISSTHAAVGNDRDDVGFSLSAGSVTIFEFDSQSKTWINQQRIFASDSDPNQSFGNSVSLNNGTLLIGAIGDDQNGDNSGAAYIFNLDADKSLWKESQKLLPNDGDAFDWFGGSLGVTDEFAIVGAMFDDENGESSGSVYSFVREPLTGSWIQQQKLVPSDTGADMLFGNSVAIDGRFLLVGARWADSGGRSDAGQAYIFSSTGDSMLWQEKQIIAETTPGSFASFAFSVAIAGEQFVIGTIWDRIDGVRAGSASLYRLGENGDSFEKRQTFFPFEPVDDDDFGSAVSLTQKFIFVGARGEDIGRGSAYVYFVPPIFKDGFEK